MRLSWLAGIAVALVAGAAQASAGGDEAARAAAVACMAGEQAAVDPVMAREDKLSQYEKMTPRCRKAIVIACGAVAREELLDIGTAADCSISYEALLRRDFGGNFQALVVWWQNRHGDRALQ